MAMTIATPVKVAMALQLTAFKKLRERVCPIPNGGDGTGLTNNLNGSQIARIAVLTSPNRRHRLSISMNGAKFQGPCIYIDVLKAPIQRAPTSLMEIVQYHFCHHLYASYP